MKPEPLTKNNTPISVLDINKLYRDFDIGNKPWTPELSKEIFIWLEDSYAEDLGDVFKYKVTYSSKYNGHKLTSLIGVMIHFCGVYNLEPKMPQQDWSKPRFGYLFK